MALVQERCLHCSQLIMMDVGQHIVHGALVWHGGYACPNCQAHVEFDEAGIPPEQIRQALLAQEGEWQLIIQETEDRALRALKVLRASLDLPLGAMTPFRKRIPGSVMTGTKAEVDRIRTQLVEAGLLATMSRLV